MPSSEREPQAPLVLTRRGSTDPAGRRGPVRSWCAVVLAIVMLCAGLGVARVDANPEPGLTPLVNESPGEDAAASLLAGKVAAAAPARLRKVAAAPVPKAPVAPPENALPLQGGLHPRVKAAYQQAQRMAASRWPRCGMRWTILAAIGTVESANGAHQEGAVVLESTGTIQPPVIGLPLDGKGGRGAISDSDGGSLDGDVAHDRAVGPMQMIPSTWARHAQDGNGDGVIDPQSIDDAAAAAASYLCAAAGGNLRDVEALDRAIFSYNHSEEYVLSVRTQLERLDRTNGFGALAPLVTEAPPPEPSPAEEPPVAASADAAPATTTSELTPPGGGAAP